MAKKKIFLLSEEKISYYVGEDLFLVMQGLPLIEEGDLLIVKEDLLEEEKAYLLLVAERNRLLFV